MSRWFHECVVVDEVYGMLVHIELRGRGAEPILPIVQMLTESSVVLP